MLDWLPDNPLGTFLVGGLFMTIGVPSAHLAYESYKRWRGLATSPQTSIGSLGNGLAVVVGQARPLHPLHPLLGGEEVIRREIEIYSRPKGKGSGHTLFRAKTFDDYLLEDSSGAVLIYGASPLEVADRKTRYWDDMSQAERDRVFDTIIGQTSIRGLTRLERGFFAKLGSEIMYHETAIWPGDRLCVYGFFERFTLPKELQARDGRTVTCLGHFRNLREEAIVSTKSREDTVRDLGWKGLVFGAVAGPCVLAAIFFWLQLFL